MSLPHLLLLSSVVYALDSLLLLLKKLRTAYTLFAQSEWVARGRSQDTQGAKRGPTCRSGLSPHPAAGSFGTDRASAKLLNPMRCV